jgi:hypothetical protein
MSEFSQIELSADKKSVKIGTGLDWGQVYTALEPHGLVVVGGRSPSDSRRRWPPAQQWICMDHQRIWIRHRQHPLSWSVPSGIISLANRLTA